MNIIGRKKLFFIISGLVIIPGLIFLILYGLVLSIEFTGGSKLEYQLASEKNQISVQEVTDIANKQGAKVIAVQKSKDRFTIRTNPIDQKMYQNVTSEIKKKYIGVKELGFETVGATIGDESKINAIKAVLIASLVIALYIAFAFREVSKPVASWKFGVSAIVALLHDVLIVVGLFAILGKLFHVEVDSLFITALLTVMGFSVHDTIVVFDRIRENLKKNVGLSFHEVVNNSILETFNRSLNTSLTVTLVLFSLLLFGGESIRWFVVALLIGIISGTYSSIFNAAPLLVAWYEWDKKRNSRQ